MFFIKNEFNYSCQNVNYDTSEHGIAGVHVAYAYFMLKLLDLIDTVS
jgi:hypothetical protein